MYAHVLGHYARLRRCVVEATEGILKAGVVERNDAFRADAAMRDGVFVQETEGAEDLKKHALDAVVGFAPGEPSLPNLDHQRLFAGSDGPVVDTRIEGKSLDNAKLLRHCARCGARSAGLYDASRHNGNKIWVDRAVDVIVPQTPESERRLIRRRRHGLGLAPDLT